MPKPRRKTFEVVRFVPVEKVFQPQVQVRALHDLNGWADREGGVKWHIPAGRLGMLDADTAREFQVKGYVEIIAGDITPVSENEKAEMLSTKTVISMGEKNG